MAPPAARLSAAPPGACKCRAGPSSACGHASVPPFTCEEHRTFCLSPAARCPSRHMPASAARPHFPPAAGHLRAICLRISRIFISHLRCICTTVHPQRTPRIFRPRCICAVLRRLCGVPDVVLFPFRQVLARRLRPTMPLALRPAYVAHPRFLPAAGYLRPHVPCEYHASLFLTYGASAPSCAACAVCRTSFFSLSGKCSPGALGRLRRLALRPAASAAGGGAWVQKSCSRLMPS